MNDLGRALEDSLLEMPPTEPQQPFFGCFIHFSPERFGRKTNKTTTVPLVLARGKGGSFLGLPQLRLISIHPISSYLPT